jgi:hypothetical protein
MQDCVQLNQITTPQLAKHLGQPKSRSVDDDLMWNAANDGASRERRADQRARVGEESGRMGGPPSTGKRWFV